MQQITIAIKNFNDRVKQMNQTNSKQLILSVEEARNLHSDIYSLLNNLTEIALSSPKIEPTNNTNLDGGLFK